MNTQTSPNPNHGRQARWERVITTLGVVLCLTTFGPSLCGVTLADLRNDPHLTPSRFARYFSNFKFHAHAEIQTPESFLATESGDCGDYARLAADILREKGYTTKLVVICMPAAAHAVCYVAETHCYLDYNNRGFLFRTVSVGGSPASIACKVSRSFESDWVWVTEYSFRPGEVEIIRKETLVNPRPRIELISMVAR
jgi:hypothetical protein